MFQYALGRRLALENNDQLLLDLSWFEGDNPDGPNITDRSYTIENFDIAGERATMDDILDVIRFGKHGLSVANSPLSAYFPAHVGRYLNYYVQLSREPDSPDPNWAYRARYHPDIVDINGDAYLNGFWQSYKYLIGVEETLRDDFTVTTPLLEESKDIVETIENNTTVSIHVRRGDYVRQGPGQGNALPVEYFKTAVDVISGHVDDPHYLVFSDDIEWSEWYLRHLSDQMTFVGHTDGTTDYEDLRLMRSCDHQIMANSTFSWWGAWLNDNDEKIVIAPYPWKRFGHQYGVLDKWDYYPDNWRKLRWR
ncbi:alpha-1,2-fucosyltransferase [Haloarcula sp. GH36]|uniref:alpha-1,2-fucosyltransferase n=1 Tax=Haloarcula montana TaxID=3111776 RepID=UPI002D796833|nr:alpha-1,2-fucosyltransferase [Haloarcula sp. GH36]